MSKNFRVTGPIACVIAFAALALLAALPTRAAEPLPSWNDGPAKGAILKFVQEVTRKGGPAFVPPGERIAVFDNDGTLWTEKPLPLQAFFVLARVKELAPQHPEWRTKEPFKSILAGDTKALEAMPEGEIAALMIATHAGMTEEAFEQVVQVFLSSWKHPVYKVGCGGLVYKPMLELLDHLRANGFKTFICSGGGIDFVRQVAPKIYGIPPEQVIGSSLKYQYQQGAGGGAILRQPAINLVTDGPGKPVGIQLHIGLRPLLSAGNSDGDLQMLEFTSGRKSPTLEILVHHDDAQREFAYDKGAEKAFAEAAKSGWTVVDMKRDWKVIFPAEKK